MLVLQLRAEQSHPSIYQPVQQVVSRLSRRRLWRRWPLRIHAAREAAVRHCWHRNADSINITKLLSMYTLRSFLPPARVCFPVFPL